MIDAQKLAKWVTILGVLLLVIGGFRYMTNRPVQAKEGGNIFQAMGSMLAADDENMRRQEKRSGAMKILFGGVIGTFLGVAVAASVKEEEKP